MGSATRGSNFAGQGTPEEIFENPRNERTRPYTVITVSLREPVR